MTRVAVVALVVVRHPVTILHFAGMFAIFVCLGSILLPNQIHNEPALHRQRRPVNRSRILS
jgi:hypothetical protein